MRTDEEKISCLLTVSTEIRWHEALFKWRETPEDEKNLDPNKKQNPGKVLQAIGSTLGSRGPPGYG